eukprot:GDKI01006426.1.p1 GENE.GDKI01006426.1~~GDKI01006426.1.p1  ORF type:complete len:295 (-),score=107.21 GDKI01006426.1:156-1040(-)
MHTRTHTQTTHTSKSATCQCNESDTHTTTHFCQSPHTHSTHTTTAPQQQQQVPSRHQRSSSNATRVTQGGGGDNASVVSYGGSTFVTGVMGGDSDVTSQAATTIVPQQPTTTTATPLSAAEDANRAVADYQFFLQYTYTPECALLAFNFTEALHSLGVFGHFDSMPDKRVVAVQVTYLFYKYQMHHNDMALDLALCLTYLEEAVQKNKLTLFEKSDGFNVLMYSVFLAHVWNNDRTVCLSDWYKEVGWQTFAKCCQLNAYVLNLMQRLRNYRLRASNERVRDWVLRLCTAPKLM